MFYANFQSLSLPDHFQSKILSVAVPELTPFVFSKRADVRALRTFRTIHLFQFFPFSP